MQLDAILEIAIGLVVTWLILSMATSQIHELITEWGNKRSNFLEQQILEMFKDPGLVEKFYKHPLIDTLSSKTMLGKPRKPIEIPNPIFAKAAVDIFLNAGKNDADIPAGTMSLAVMKQSMLESLKHLDNTNRDFSRSIKYLVPRMDDENINLEKKLAEYRGNVENWFDSTMLQASKIYKKNAVNFAMIIGFSLAAVFNVDSFYIVNQLWRDPTLRQSIVAQAANIDPNESLSVVETKTKLDELSLPVGWNTVTTAAARKNWPLKIFGVFLTGLAAAQGAPFWFDILRKLVRVNQQPSK